MGAANSEKPMRPGWRRKVIGFMIAFGISLIVGRAFETVSDEETLAAAQRAQAGWFSSLSRASPFAVAQAFGREYDSVLAEGRAHSYINDAGELINVTSDGDLKRGFGAPMKAFFMTIVGFVTNGGIVGLALIAMGMMSVGVINLRLSGGRSVDFGGPVLTWFAGPFAVILAASVIAVILKAVMLAALGGLSWVTTLAGGAAGATGVAGFCWYCVAKLGEKGAEHALTPRL
jgi:hypothetical protein